MPFTELLPSSVTKTWLRHQTLVLAINLTLDAQKSIVSPCAFWNRGVFQNPPYLQLYRSLNAEAHATNMALVARKCHVAPIKAFFPFTYSSWRIRRCRGSCLRVRIVFLLLMYVAFVSGRPFILMDDWAKDFSDGNLLFFFFAYRIFY